MRLFDLHCDTLYECFTKNYPLSKNGGHIDLERAERFSAYGQVFAVWIPDELRGAAAWRFCRRVLEFAEAEEERCDGRIKFMCKGDNLADCFAVSPCIGVKAIEGGAALAGDLSHIDDLEELGVKFLTLTWNGANELGNGCGVVGGEGLTAFGKAAVKRLSSAGIVPDVSHLNEAGFWDVAEVLPNGELFVATHSNAAAVCPHPRNLTDRQFTEIMRRSGVVGLNLCGDFLGEQSMERLERHWAHFLSLGGEDAVCFGGDLDGIRLPPEWDGLAVMECIWNYLCRKNYESRLIEKLFFGNCYDFLTQL